MNTVLWVDGKQGTASNYWYMPYNDERKPYVLLPGEAIDVGRGVTVYWGDFMDADAYNGRHRIRLRVNWTHNEDRPHQANTESDLNNNSRVMSVTLKME